MVQHNNYWFLTAPTKNTIASGLIRNVDILIIGGGITGVNLLYQLLLAGASNTYLIEENTVGYHSSGRGAGQLFLRGAKLFSKMPEQEGIEYLKFMTENNRKVANGIKTIKFDTDFRHTGGLRLAVNEEEFQELANEARFINQHSGLECPILDANATQHLFPSSGFVGGIYIPTEATFNPYKFVNGLREFIENKGPRILTNSSVQSVTENADGTLNVTIRHKGTIRAKKVVYCNDAYISELVPELSSVLVPHRGQIIVTDYLSDSITQTFPQMSISCHNGNEYFRLYGGRLLIGGMRHAVRGQQTGITNDGETSIAVYEKLRSFLNDVLAFVGEVNISHTWSGIMTSTKDGLPIIGKLTNRPSQFVFAGFGHYGFSHALQGSMLLRDIILQENFTSNYSQLFNPARPSCN